MAKELAHFQNFGKLKDTKVAFNDITVIAGKPGTGKSYVMKFMYTLDEAMSSIVNGNYKMHYTLMDTDGINKMIGTLVRNDIIFQDILLEPYKSRIKELLDESNYLELSEIIKEIIGDNEQEALDGAAWFNHFKQYVTSMAEKQKKSLKATEEEKFHFVLRNILESIFNSIEQIESEFSFANNQSKISYDENGLHINSLKIVQEIENALFVETPLILEFEKFLPSDRFQTPYHIDSLLKELNKSDFSFTSEETSNFIKHFQKSTREILKGSISKGTQGFSFESQTGKNYNIINASSGTKSIGLLQYLVTNKALKKGSVLYWEEPEVHLHPEWQLRMIELFMELMNAGVKIVFSTHSPYMCDYLNAISQKKGFDDRVSFNLFEETNGVVKNHILENDDDWNKIQAELLDPLEEIMWEYI